MVFTIFFLCGIMGSSLAMEAFPNPNIEVTLYNNPFVSAGLIYPSVTVPSSAPCDNCVKAHDNVDEIVKLLQEKNIVAKGTCTVIDQLSVAIDEKKIANKRTELDAILSTMVKWEFVKHTASLRANLANIYDSHLSKEKPSIPEFVFECAQELVKPIHQPVPLEKNKPKKPWEMSENLNNAFILIGSDIKKLFFFTLAGSLLFVPLFALGVNINRHAIPLYCGYKGLLSHTNPQQCKCHAKPNKTFRCAYRLIYLGLGMLFFLYSCKNELFRLPVAFFDFLFHVR